jgi:hypothetical protein
MRPTSLLKRRLRDVVLVLLLVIPGLGVSQTVPSKATLTVQGYAGQVPVIQVNGKSYVEIESLARLTSSTLSIHADQITFTLAAAAVNTTPAPADQPKPAFSRDFLVAEIEEMTVVREWRIAIVNAVQNSYTIAEDSVAGYGMNADSKLALASAAAVTVSDRNVLPLLGSEFKNMQAMSERYLAMRKSLTYISPDSLDGDPLDQQILSCARGLAALAAIGLFEDVPVCH